MSNLAELAIAGTVVTPDDDGWDDARAAWNLVADQRPEAVAPVESADDVAEALSSTATGSIVVRSTHYGFHRPDKAGQI